MRSRPTPVDPNAFLIRPNALSLDACRSKHFSGELKYALARRLFIQMLECAQTTIFVRPERRRRWKYYFRRANNLVTTGGAHPTPTPLRASLKHILATDAVKPVEKQESSNPSVTSSVEEGREESLISKGKVKAHRLRSADHGLGIAGCTRKQQKHTGVITRSWGCERALRVTPAVTRLAVYCWPQIMRLGRTGVP